MINDKDYKHIILIASQKIRKYISNTEDIEDLAQSVVMKYYLNLDKINQETRNGWIAATARNLAIDYLRKQDKLNENAVNFDDFEAKITDTVLNPENKETPEKIFAELKGNISAPERKLLEEYAKNSFQIKKMSKRKKMSYEAIKKKIYRLKADLRAQYNLENGMIATKAIIGAKLNENILNFLKKFKSAIKKNDLNCMKIYFRDCDIPTEISDINIDKVHSYDVIMDEDRNYDIYVIEKVSPLKWKTFIVKISIYNENSIKIIEFPKLPSNHRSFKKKDIPIEVATKMTAKRPNGKPLLSKSELEDLLYENGLITEKLY